MPGNVFENRRPFPYHLGIPPPRGLLLKTSRSIFAFIRANRIHSQTAIHATK